MSKTLWIGDVQDNWTEDYLFKLLQNAKGLVSVKLMRNRVTNELEGYGFIDFVSEEDAILALNGYNGRPIPNTGYTFRLNFGGSNKNINVTDNYCVYIGDLETSITEAQLYTIFKEKYISFCGAKIMRDSSTGLNKGFGFIQFRARDEAETALREMNGYIINGRPIRLSYASAKRWLNEDEAPKVTTGTSAKVDVLMEGPEIPNIRPPPPTTSMIAKSIANNSVSSVNVVDVYGNAYENHMFFDPLYQSAVKAKMQKRMKMNQEKQDEENEIQVPNDRFTQFSVEEENRKFISKSLQLFELQSLAIPKYNI